MCVYLLEASSWTFCAILSLSTVADLVQALGGETFIELTKKTATQAMKEAGISKKLIDELITPVTRLNYGQAADTINAFTGRYLLY